MYAFKKILLACALEVVQSRFGFHASMEIYKDDVENGEMNEKARLSYERLASASSSKYHYFSFSQARVPGIPRHFLGRT